VISATCRLDTVLVTQCAFDCIDIFHHRDNLQNVYREKNKSSIIIYTTFVNSAPWVGIGHETSPRKLVDKVSLPHIRSLT
jgi:hypothetical protein